MDQAVEIRWHVVGWLCGSASMSLGVFGVAVNWLGGDWRLAMGGALYFCWAGLLVLILKCDG